MRYVGRGIEQTVRGRADVGSLIAQIRHSRCGIPAAPPDKAKRADDFMAGLALRRHGFADQVGAPVQAPGHVFDHGDAGKDLSRSHVDAAKLSFDLARDCLRLTGKFYDEWRIPRRWNLDEPSPFEYNRVLDPVPSKAMTDGALAKLKQAFPIFEKVEISQRWAGMIDVTPDAIPVIDAVDAIPGFHVATGFSGHGFGIGPAAGKLMADIVTGRNPIVDRHDFRFSRFSDGSKIKLVSGF